LNFDRAARRIDRAGEFHQQAVTGGLDDASAMLGNSRIDDGFSDGLEPGQRAFFVGAHQPAIASNIRRQHCRKPPFHPRAGQTAPPSGLVYSTQPI
jgi:hypothetical protein